VIFVIARLLGRACGMYPEVVPYATNLLVADLNGSKGCPNQ